MDGDLRFKLAKTLRATRATRHLAPPLLKASATQRRGANAAVRIGWGGSVRLGGWWTRPHVGGAFGAPNARNSTP